MSDLLFAHISDLHLPFEPQLSLRQHLSKRQLSVWSWYRRRSLHRTDILDALKQDLQDHAVDHVVLSGDITNFSLPGEFRQATDWLASLGPAASVSLVPGNHDALMHVPAADGLDRWAPWTRLSDGWPYVHRVGAASVIGLNSALPTAPLLARGRLGPRQLERLEQVLMDEGQAGRVRIVVLHHPAAAGAIGWRKALADGPALRSVLKSAGAELVLHGHARDARLDAIAGPREPIPCLCVPSSSALPNPKDQGARWHRLRLLGIGGDLRAEVTVRRWSTDSNAFTTGAVYELCLPRRATGTAADNPPL